MHKRCVMREHEGLVAEKRSIVKVVDVGRVDLDELENNIGSALTNVLNVILVVDQLRRGHFEHDGGRWI